MFPELKTFSRNLDWKSTTVSENKPLNDAIAYLKRTKPGMFWQEHELHQRKFYDQPIWPYPMKSFVRKHK